jgi:hypothetical protein
MKLLEAVTLKKVDDEEIIKFLKDNILSRFGVLDKFITENGSIFIGSKFTDFAENMESSWVNHKIIIHKAMNSLNPQKQHMFIY